MNLLCKVFGHKLVRNSIDYTSITEYTCQRCKQKFTTDGYGKIVKLTPYWEQNNLLFKKHSKKENN